MCQVWNWHLICGCLGCRRNGLEGLLFGLLIVALLAIPDISLLSGAIFSKDRYHHWEFFAMGPALQVRAGRALGSGAYSQYGLVFPLFLSGIDPIVPLRFDNLLRWSIGFGASTSLGWHFC